MSRYICKACGFRAEEIPESCPVCEGDGEGFEILVEAAPSWPDGHMVGICADCEVQIKEAIQSQYVDTALWAARFFAMGRQADRDGYGEMGNAYRRIAQEVLEEAARMCELLAAGVAGDTPKNRQLAVEDAQRMVAARLEIGKRAVELGYDAVHDAFHEMAKDGARHGAAFAPPQI
ncbi:NADH peroxidase [Eubacteriales bacterium OttesenSCG-928-M02]|nr:NADH peroxidase [Eubacteriales bacterium OttesenSCG-928-M02]